MQALFSCRHTDGLTEFLGMPFEEGTLVRPILQNWTLRCKGTGNLAEATCWRVGDANYLAAEPNPSSERVLPP